MPDSDFNPALVRQLVERTPFFQGFSNAEKNRVADLSHGLRSYDVGEIFIEQGTPGTEFFLLLSGEAMVQRKGHERVLARLSPGSLFGEVAFLTGGERTTRVVAQAPSNVFVIDRAVMEEVGPEIREKIKDSIAVKLFERLDAQNQKLAKAAFSRPFPREKRDRVMRLKVAPESLTPVHIAALMEKLKFFQGFSKYERRRVAAVDAHVKLFEGGQIIVREGEVGKTFYVILEGTVSVYKKMNATLLTVLEPGDYFGEVAFFSGRARTTTVRADGATILLEVGEKLLSNLGVNIRERFKDGVIGGLLQRLDQQNRFLTNL